MRRPTCWWCLGGPISAAQHFAGQQHYAFLNDELALVTQRLQQKRPTLGVCLGAQVMAQALGPRWFRSA
ncbi:glutamine amidotransferase [Serratia quinivorans]|uniref:Glutamine amidotransferase n=1 Tax=Serratia quinivorans TaxID=137545 RepID=A0A380AW18_9GAMM|nr:glutamine amidotransferase [Serratia quinivorans]